MFDTYFNTQLRQNSINNILDVDDTGAAIEDRMLELEAAYDGLLVAYDVQYAAFERGEWYADIALLSVIDQLEAIESELANLDERLAVLEIEFDALDAILRNAA